MIYDFAVIGSGIAGLSAGYFLSLRGAKVAIVDKSTLLSGASSAAGAFLSPSIGKDNQIKTCINNSLRFSLDFYEKNAFSSFVKNGVIRVAKDAYDEEKIRAYESSMDFEYSIFKPNEHPYIKTNLFGYCFSEGGIVDVEDVAHFLSQNVYLYENLEIKALKKDGDIFNLDRLKAKNIVLATGAHKKLLDEPYLEIRSIFGQRVEIETTTKVPINVHQNISISANRKSGTVAIGATNIRNVFHKEMDEAQNLELIKSAKELIELENIKIVGQFSGARAASKDYMPIIGKLVDSKKTLEKIPQIRYAKRRDAFELEYHDNLYILNGLGARGYVYAPYMGKILSDLLINGKEIDKSITTNRLFIRWVKRL